MGAEDFGWMLRARPGCYALLGAGDRPMLHHPLYDFPDDLLVHGALYWIQLARTFLQNPPKINDFSLDLSET
jgi:hippurate hydrolase